MLRLLRGRVGDGLTLIGVGGITTVEDARARLDAGADLLQGYTAFVYEGPGWPRRIVKGVQRDRSGSASRPRSRPAARCAPASTRTPACSPSGDCPTTCRGWSGSRSPQSRAWRRTSPLVKPQSAFYERFGSRGVAVLERVIAASRAAGALVLLDVKRGDIGSTTQAYADAYLDPASPLAADAITASPYLGFGSLDPMVDTARKYDAGVFVLALTSNKEGAEVQHARTEDGATGRRPDARPPARAQRGGRSRSARSERSSAPRSVLPTPARSSTSRSTARSWPPVSAPRAARSPTSAGSSAAPSRPSRPARRVTCCASGPSVDAMRIEALRLNDELRS